MFEEEAQATADAQFDEFMLNRAQQGALFADFVMMVNMKATAIANDLDLSPTVFEAKMDLLTELLNDMKLFTTPAVNDMPN